MSSNQFIDPGIWKIVFIPKDVALGKIHVNLTSPDKVSEKLRNTVTDNKTTANIDEVLNKLSENNGTIGGMDILYEQNFEEEFAKLKTPYVFYKIGDNFGVVFYNRNNTEDIERVRNLNSITRVSPYTRLASMSVIEESVTEGVTGLEEIEGNYFKNNPNISITGKGVIISIIDSGIDYLHDAFIYPDGTSKIVYLWDQTKDKNPPKGYYNGTEYTREQINEAIKNKDSSLSKDEEGSGTMLSGICVGLKNEKNQYVGIAEDAELIVIKLKKIQGYYNNAMYYAAHEYAQKKAEELKMPLVINDSLGSNYLADINRRILGKSLFFTQGICEVGAAGNEGNTRTHTSGKLTFKGEEKDVSLELSEDEDTIEIEILVNRPDRVNVAILSPSGEISKLQQVSNNGLATGKFDLESTDYIINYLYPTSYSGQEKITISLRNAKKGIWKIRLVGEYITNGIYQMYLSNRVFIKSQTQFREVDPMYTINYPSTLDDIIAVGAYDSINKSLAAFSSRGPTIKRLKKPDVVAPGVKIIGPYPGNKYATITGTSASAAFVSGTAALFLQYTLVDEVYPDKAYIQKIRTYIRSGAKQEKEVTYPNESYGYGLLNIRETFEQLK